MLLVGGLNIPEHNRTVHDWLDTTTNRLSMIALWRHEQDLLLYQGECLIPDHMSGAD